MALKDKRKSAHITRDGYAYITKRFVVRRAQTAGRLAAARAMKTMGYVVTLRGGWVIKEHQDGSIERLVRIGAKE
jgi:hypothetical protein